MPQPLIVVIVDDEPDIRQVLCDILEDEGYEVVGLGHPSLALALDAAQRPSIFLLDLMLPGMTGLELAGRIREGPFADASIIAISASPSMLRRASESRLFQAILSKPFDIDQLVDTLRRYAA